MVATFSREEFLTRRWRYEPGQHVTILGRTGSGKTMLAHQLLARTARPELPVINLVAKPRDATALKFTRDNGLRTARSWPPLPRLGAAGNGWTVWPNHVFIPDDDDRAHWEIFQAAILDAYKRGPHGRIRGRMVYIPDVTTLTRQLHHPEERRTLSREVETVWSKGRSMGCGLWADDQRPAWLSTLAYSSADHLFLAYEPDARYRKRFDEIGGVDPKEVSETVFRLPRFHFLYIRRADQARCVIQP